jgi:hypothetical protein
MRFIERRKAMSEKDYDEIIAPMLAEVAKKCEELGMQMVARVEWEPGNCGVTAFPPSIDAMKSGGMLVAATACLCHGNVDRLCISLSKRPGADQSIFLQGYLDRTVTMRAVLASNVKDNREPQT